MTSNKLQLNEQKTEFFVTSTSYKLSNLPELKLKIGNAEIAASPTVKNLGVTFDTTMSMSKHVSNMCRSINFHLRNMFRIRRYIDFDCCNHLARSLITSRLDYANALLYGIKSRDLKRLQSLQNRAARLVFRVPRDHNAEVLLSDLHWLPVNDRILFKSMLYVYKCLNHEAPSYLADCLCKRLPGREGMRSGQDSTRLYEPRTNLVTAGDRSFQAFAPREWNKLPTTIRESISASSFKGKLKTHLFPRF